MAYSPVEQAYMDGIVSAQFPDPVEPDPVLLADSGQVKSDAQGSVTVQGFKGPVDPQAPTGSIGPIPRNKAQEALGYVGELLTKAGVELDKYGIDIPKLGRITLKDLTVGEAGRVIEDMSYGFYPIEGGGGFISGTTRVKPDEAFELLNVVPIAGAALKAGSKAAVKGVTKAIEATKNMPVGMSVKEVGQGVDELGFYSAASKAVDNIQQPKGTGDQFLKQIEKTPGVKPDELKWTGLDDFLKSKKSVTKEEVKQYLDQNLVEIKEVQLGSGPNPYPHRTADEWQEAINKAEKAGDFDESERLTNAWEAFEGFGMDDQTKFSKYTLPGGENYREVLLTLPRTGEVKAVSATSDGNVWDVKMANGKEISFPVGMANDKAEAFAYAQNQTGTNFRSSHFDQPNVLAHIRVNDRIDADGKKVLFVEEVQSDWHQAGRKKGYNEQSKLDAILSERKQLLDEKARLEKLAEPYTNQGKDAPSDILDKWNMASNRINDLQTAQNRLGQAVPDAPFKTTWHELAMKRAIQMAAEGGYDRIAFTTGATQAARYDLSKQVERIISTKEGDGFRIFARDANGTNHDMGIVAQDDLPDVVGKDLAKKIADQKKDSEVFEGVDLKVGGEGMKGFYDNILPKFLDKYAKKWDAKTGMTDIVLEKAGSKYPSNIRTLEGGSIKRSSNTVAPVHYLEITPKMKESVVTQGQPMFAIGAGGAGAAATQQEEKK